MGKAEENKKHKRDALLNTAFDLFSSKGLNNTTISDIVNKAGMAKGTFYLYFKDKYDLHHKLIAHKTSQLFMNAYRELQQHPEIKHFDDKVIFITDHILEQLAANKPLITLVNRNLSWGVFLGSIEKNAEQANGEFLQVYRRIVRIASSQYRDPEVMLFMIIELIGSTCYNVILYNDPVSLNELKPDLYHTIRSILQAHKLPEASCYPESMQKGA